MMNMGKSKPVRHILLRFGNEDAYKEVEATERQEPSVQLKIIVRNIRNGILVEDSMYMYSEDDIEQGYEKLTQYIGAFFDSREE